MSIILTKSDIGIVRERNEDYCWAGKNDKKDLLMIVCDGLGSYDGSFEASKIVVETFKENFLKMNYGIDLRRWFVNNINEIKIKFKKLIEKLPQYKNMSTTIVMSLIIDDAVHTFWIGDSRAYILSKRKAEQLTEDHNLLNYLKKIKPNKNVFLQYKDELFSVTHFIDKNEDNIEYDYSLNRMRKNDIIFLCSDGLHNFVEMDSLYKKLVNNTNGNDIIELAINNASDDNISFTSFFNGK